jgi:N-terminal half of MaoC dehydratase
MLDTIAIGDTLPVFERTTDFPEWNRYAAVNDEFIDVHMSSDWAQAAGQRDVFGMGNLRVGYLHCALYDWLDGRGDIASFSCQFRQLNWRQDQLTTHATVTGAGEVDGLQVVDLAVGVVNQNGEETTPGTAQVVLFDAGDGPRMPAEPGRAAIPTRDPGVYLDDATIGWLGKPLAPLPSLPIDANDIRRWAQAEYYPDAPPPALFDVDAARDSPWGELVAPRDFNPFAWNPDHHPEAYPWMRGMGTEPGYRGLNGGQSNWYFAPMRVGDVVTADVTLIDAFEKEGKVGTMMFLVDETRLTNQRGELVRITHRVSIYS